MIKLNEELKLANYGQWDGYPTGQGETIAAFIQAYLLDDTLRAEFAAKVAKLKFGTDAELAEIEKDWEKTVEKHEAAAAKGHYVSKYELAKFVAFDRDTGATILQKIWEGLGCDIVKDDSEFLKDTLFCEWAYCVDLDTCKVDVYVGGLKGTDGADGKPAASIPFTNFTVISMRTLEKRLRANADARARRAAKKASK
jgi:hypothetical protein